MAIIRSAPLADGGLLVVAFSLRFNLLVLISETTVSARATIWKFVPAPGSHCAHGLSTLTLTFNMLRAAAAADAGTCQVSSPARTGSTSLNSPIRETRSRITASSRYQPSSTHRFHAQAQPHVFYHQPRQRLAAVGGIVEQHRSQGASATARRSPTTSSTRMVTSRI